MFTKYGKKITDAEQVEVERVGLGESGIVWMLKDRETGDRLCSQPTGLGFYSFDSLGDAVARVAEELA